jgi:uncharacterized protein (DUF3084 family)
MTDQSDDLLSRLQQYEKRVEEWLDNVKEDIEREAPEVLDKLASTAKDIAQRLDDMANGARQKRAEKEGTPEPAGTSEATPAPTVTSEASPEPAATSEGASEPPDEPPAPSGESGTASA